MLIQKMTKEALLIESNLDREDNIKELKDSSKKFDSIFSNLPTLNDEEIDTAVKGYYGSMGKLL